MSSFHSVVVLRCEMAIAAVIVFHRRAEKSNFIDIQGEKKEENPFRIKKKKKKKIEA